MAKKRESEEAVTTAENTDAAPKESTNGDSKPVPKAPRDKAESFKRVGNQRLAKAVYAMRRLVPLANRNAYTFTDEQALKIRTIANDLAKEVQAAFSIADTTAEPPESFF